MYVQLSFQKLLWLNSDKLRIRSIAPLPSRNVLVIRRDDGFSWRGREIPRNSLNSEQFYFFFEKRFNFSELFALSIKHNVRSSLDAMPFYWGGLTNNGYQVQLSFRADPRVLKPQYLHVFTIYTATEIHRSLRKELFSVSGSSYGIKSLIRIKEVRTLHRGGRA